MNRFGAFTMRADSLSSDSSLQRMIKLAKEAEEQIRNLTGISVKVTPFIVCVGWFVRKTIAGTPEVLVVNEEGLSAFVQNCPGALSPTDADRISKRLMEACA